MKLFAMYDVKAAFYMQPFPETSTVAALRGFEVAVNNSDSIFTKFPDDFCLMELAEFNQHTGQIIPYDHPQNLGTARTVIRNQIESSLNQPRQFKLESPVDQIRN